MAFLIFFLIMAVFTSVSIATLGTFPQISIDEIGNCAIADHFLKTKTTVYPLLAGVVHPSFSYLSGLADLGLRVPYFFILGNLQRVLGTGYIPARAVSLVIAGLIGFLLFIKIRKEINVRAACIGLLFWICSLDAFMVSHLVREDAFVVLLYVLLPLLIVNSNLSHQRLGWFLAGVCGPLAFLGFHPNGLFVMGAGVFLYFLQVRKIQNPGRAGVSLLQGMAAGTAISLAFVDIETYVLAKSAITHSFYASRLSLWTERAQPWNFIADTVLYFIRAKSFYISDPLIRADVWQSSTLCAFFSFLLSALWIIFFDNKNYYRRTMAWLAVFAIFALGFGAGREEYIYRVLVLVTAIPLLAYVLDKAWSKIAASGEALFSWAAILGLCGYFWVFRWNLFFFIAFLLVVLAMHGLSDRAILATAGVALLALFFVWLRDKPFASGLSSGSLRQMTRPLSLVIFGFSSMMTGTVLFRFRQKNWWKPVLLASFFFWSLALAGAATWAHATGIGFKNRSLNATLQDMDKLVGPFDGRILGPSYLWFWKKDQIFDIGGILMDYYYSGQKRPRECIERVHPQLLVIDDEFKRRYLLVKNADGKSWQTVPLSKLIAAPIRYVGSIKESLHHSHLDVIEIDWPKK